jgi:hypothetical protein
VTRWADPAGTQAEPGPRLDPSVQATGRILLGMDKDLWCQAP